MQKIQKALFGGAIMAAGVSAHAQAFEQAPAANNAFASNDPSSAPYLDFVQADNFSVGADATQLTGATFFGLEEIFLPPSFPPGNVTGWQIQIFEDAAGLPGASLLDQFVAIGDSTVTSLGTGNPLAAELFQIDVSFSLSVAADTQYWFSYAAVLADGFGGNNWFWADSADGDGAWASSAAGAPFAPAPGDGISNGLAFSIEGVPTPGAAGLLGFAGLAAARRRR